MNHWPVIVVGGSGYVAGEMLRLVSLHPELDLAASVSTSQAGEPIAATFAHLAPVLGDQCFVSLDAALDNIGGRDHWVLLSAAPHGAAAEIIARLLAAAKAKSVNMTVVDASADFRFRDPEQFEAIYGKPHPAPELLSQFTCAVPEQSPDISTPHAAQPGCFATSMLLGIVPLVAAGICEDDILVSAVTGSTGAGRSPRETTHHPIRQSNLFAYQPLVHRHEPEVSALTRAASGKEIKLGFVPHSGPFARGIHATIFARAKGACDADEIVDLLTEYYRASPFVRVQPAPPRLKDIAGSNYAYLSAHVEDGVIVVCSVIDNLLKGAAGGSLQWVNRLLGLDESLGIDAPATGWAG
jgi:N-acetyl-gamma-glutamyl-phosphate reductase common form